jgi:ABC-2 type transport system permease protein
MLNLYLADLYKMRKSMTMKILLGISAACAVTVPVIAYLISQGKLSKNLSGINFLLSDASMVSILGAVLAGVFICGDFDNRSIHEAVANGNSRFAIVFGKAAFFITASFIVMLPYAIAVLIGLGTGAKFSMTSTGFIHLLISESGKSLTAAELGKIILLLLTLAIAYIGQLSVCLPFAMAFKKPVVVIVLSYGITLFTAQLQAFKNSSKAFSRIFSCTPFGGGYGFLNLSSSAQDIFKAIVVSVIFTAVMTFIAFIVFRRSEIK